MFICIRRNRERARAVPAITVFFAFGSKVEKLSCKTTKMAFDNKKSVYVDAFMDCLLK